AIFAPSRNPSATPDLTFFETSNNQFDSVFTLNQYVCGGVDAAFCDQSFTNAVKQGNDSPTLAGRIQAFRSAWAIAQSNAYFVTIAQPYEHDGLAKGFSFKPRRSTFVYFNEILKAG